MKKGVKNVTSVVIRNVNYMSIYTKKGDKGTTSLFNPALYKEKRIPKSAQRIRVIGEIDELNSFLGIISSKIRNKDTKKFIIKIQKNLFTINAVIAGAKLSFKNEETKFLEKKIDKIEKLLPPLKNFIIPGGDTLASEVMYARTIARRAERELVALSKKEKVKPSLLKYINRLSDALFMVSRNINFAKGKKETPWKPR